jgi:ADP-ribose pyrophosphatase
VKPLKTEVAFETPWFRLLAKTMKEGDQPYYSLVPPDYVSLIALTEEGRVVIVRQYRPAVERYTLELPSGLIDPGESPDQTARRELLEETGFEAGEVEVLGSMDADTGRLGNRSWVCFAKDVRPVAGRAPEAGIDVLEWRIEDLYKAIVEDRFSNGLHRGVVLRGVLLGKLPGAAQPG